MRAVIGETLIHEVGHYFGLSEDEIEEIEERYWRGETLGPDDDEPRTTTAGRGRTRARKRFGQHFLEPAWVGEARRRLDAAAGRHVPRDRPGPRCAHAAAGAARRRASSPSKSIATSPRRLPHGVPGERARRRGRFPRRRPRRRCCQRRARRRSASSATFPTTSSSPILFRLLDAGRRGPALRDATLMLQKEVADRLVAQPGTGDYGVAGDPGGAAWPTSSASSPCRPGAFRPPPKVTLRGRPAPLPPAAGRRRRPRDVFEQLVRGVFLQRRKTLLERAASRWPTRSGVGAPMLLAARRARRRRRPET